MIAGFIGGNLTRIHQFFYVAMIMGNSYQCTVMEQVDARIAYVRNGHLVAFNKNGRSGRAHAGLSDAFLGGFNDGLVGGFNCRTKKDVVGRVGSLLADNFYGDGTCHFSGGMTAHTVADRKERCAQKKRVFVVLAYKTHVRAGSPRYERVGSADKFRIRSSFK